MFFIIQFFEKQTYYNTGGAVWGFCHDEAERPSHVPCGSYDGVNTRLFLIYTLCFINVIFLSFLELCCLHTAYKLFFFYLCKGGPAGADGYELTVIKNIPFRTINNILFSFFLSAKTIVISILYN